MYPWLLELMVSLQPLPQQVPKLQSAGSKDRGKAILEKLSSYNVSLHPLLANIVHTMLD